VENRDDSKHGGEAIQCTLLAEEGMPEIAECMQEVHSAENVVACGDAELKREPSLMELQRETDTVEDVTALGENRASCTSKGCRNAGPLRKPTNYKDMAINK
jgi:hypothetical protein